MKLIIVLALLLSTPALAQPPCKAEIDRVTVQPGGTIIALTGSDFEDGETATIRGITPVTVRFTSEFLVELLLVGSIDRGMYELEYCGASMVFYAETPGEVFRVEVDPVLEQAFIYGTAMPTNPPIVVNGLLAPIVSATSSLIVVEFAWTDPATYIFEIGKTVGHHLQVGLKFSHTISP